TPLPGSNLFSRLANSGSLFHDNFPIDWNRYDLGELTVLPSAMEAQEVVESVRECATKIFSNFQISLRVIKSLFKTRSIRCCIWCKHSNKYYRKVTFNRLGINDN
ncbi:hypothetical protein KAJ27_24220, partial [bacterium]|nr:hypothetical protein [bacterium]